MEALNYLRKAAESLSWKWAGIFKKEFPLDVSHCALILKTAKESQKFILPQGGRIFDDNFRGLPDELRLPFPSIMIEYRASTFANGIVDQLFDNTIPATKRIVVAVQNGVWINIYSIHSSVLNVEEVWTMQPWFAEISKEFTGKTENPPEMIAGMINADTVQGVAVDLHPTGTMADAKYGPGWRKNAYYDLMDEINAVLSLIEALSCSNVSHELLPARHRNKSARRRGTLPFDDYRVLVIKSAHEAGRPGVGGAHNSPREHLRRGHIRRLPGKKIWVQSCVVNAGIGAKVSKQYEVRA